MLEYTKAAGKRVWRNLKAIRFLFNVITQVFYIGYLLYAIKTDRGNFYVNLVLFLLSVAYFGFFSIAILYSVRRQLKRRVKLVFQWSKRLIKLVNLGIMVYALAYTTETSAVNLIMTAFLCLCWISDLTVEILSILFRAWWRLVLDGLESDWQKMTKPLRSVKSFFRRATGKEVEEEPAPTKNQIFLEELIEEERVERENQRLENEYLARKKKQEEKQRKREAKQAKKANKRNPAPSLSENIYEVTKK